MNNLIDVIRHGPTLVASGFLSFERILRLLHAALLPLLLRDPTTPCIGTVGLVVVMTALLCTAATAVSMWLLRKTRDTTAAVAPLVAVVCMRNRQTQHWGGWYTVSSIPAAAAAAEVHEGCPRRRASKYLLRMHQITP